MCWGRYFTSFWGETRCPWWERAAVSREPGQAETGLAMPGWAALHAPVGMCCSAGSISRCCTEPVTGIAASPGKEVPEPSFLLPHSHIFVSPHHQPGMPWRYTPAFSSILKGWDYMFWFNLAQGRAQDHRMLFISQISKQASCLASRLFWFSSVFKLRTERWHFLCCSDGSQAASECRKGPI